MEFGSDQASHPCSPVSQNCVHRLLIRLWVIWTSLAASAFTCNINRCVLALFTTGGLYWPSSVFTLSILHMFVPGRHRSGLNHAVSGDHWSSLSVLVPLNSNTPNIGYKIVPLLQYCRSYTDIVPVWLRKSLSKKQFVYLQEEIVLFHRPVTKFQLF